LVGEILIRNFDQPDKESFITPYQQVFAEPPWYETWTREAIEKELEEYPSSAILTLFLSSINQLMNPETTKVILAS